MTVWKTEDLFSLKTQLIVPGDIIINEFDSEYIVIDKTDNFITFVPPHEAPARFLREYWEWKRVTTNKRGAR